MTQLYTHLEMEGIFGDAKFVLPDGRKYPRSWWRTASPQQISGLGFRVYEPTVPDPTLDELIAAKKAQIDSKLLSVLATGCPVTVGEQTLHVALDDGSRADLTGMATTAVAVMASGGGISWPESYQTGWITMENVRIPLLTPADGLGLAARVGDYYACIRQNGRDLKDAALAAEDADDLDVIDVESGWPA